MATRSWSFAAWVTRLEPRHQENDWERMQEALEELADIRAYDEAKRDPTEQVPFEQAMAEIDGDAPT